MADPIKGLKKSDVPISPSEEDNEEEYELLPHKEITELKDELRRMRSMPTGAGKDIELGDLSDKIDKLIAIFTDAMHQMKIEEGGLSFQEKMRPVTEKMNKILEQNSEIAEGIVALADIMNEVKDVVEEKLKPTPKLGTSRNNFSQQPSMGPVPGMPPMGGSPMPDFGPMPEIRSGAPIPPPPRQMAAGGFPPVPPPPRKVGLFK
jgi:hypothetical protein